MEDTYVPANEVPKHHIGRPGPVWSDRFEKMKTDRVALVLYPRDRHDGHVMRSTARSSAKSRGLTVATAMRVEDDVLKLYIWLPGYLSASA